MCINVAKHMSIRKYYKAKQGDRLELSSNPISRMTEINN